MIIRIARHTDNLDLITQFYCKFLNLEVLGDFQNHGNYNGVFLGKKDLDWHLEFTTSNSNVQHQFDEDDILVFYPKKNKEYKEIRERIAQNNLKIMKSKNPYWNRIGIMIKDPDGYNVIISNLKTKSLRKST
jgi:hypothetical protein